MFDDISKMRKTQVSRITHSIDVFKKDLNQTGKKKKEEISKPQYLTVINTLIENSKWHKTKSNEV